MPAAQGQGGASAPPVAVQTTRPETRDVSRLISLPGDVHPWEETTLYAKVPGYLDRIYVDKGDTVKAGQVIATIASPELAAERDQAQDAYQSAVAAAQGSRAAGERAEADRRRALAVVSKARTDLAQMPPTVAVAKSRLKQAQSFVLQVQAQKSQAAASLDENSAQLEKASADLEAATSDRKLAEVTYERYKGIYDKDPMLIARQDVDVAESRASAARSRVSAAQAAIDAARQRVRSAKAQIAVADSQVEQAQAQVNAAEDQLRLAEAQRSSAAKQVNIAAEEASAAGKQQVAARAKVLEADYQARAGRSAVGKSVSMADYTRIRAPFSGVITRRFVDKGAFIQTASASQNAAPIVTVANLDRMRLYLTVPETQAHFLRTGTAVLITTSDQPDTPRKGRVTRTSGSLDPKTRTLLAEVDLPNSDRSILAGSYATARIVMETHPGVISVPTPAVGTEKTGKFVFVVVDGKAKRVPVTTGFDDGARTEIVEGLHGDEQVVVTGRDALTPNAKVTTSQWTPPVKKAPGKR
jgi:RND family efflux transporter MFP subunit